MLKLKVLNLWSLFLIWFFIRWPSSCSFAHLAGAGGCPGGPDFCPFWYRPNCALKFFNKFRRDALKNQFKKQKNQSKRCTNSILLKLFTPVRLIYSHSLLRNIISYRTDVNANFYCTENNLSNFCMIIRENKKEMFHF